MQEKQPVYFFHQYSNTNRLCAYFFPLYRGVVKTGSKTHRNWGLLKVDQTSSNQKKHLFGISIRIYPRNIYNITRYACWTHLPGRPLINPKCLCFFILYIKGGHVQRKPDCYILLQIDGVVSMDKCVCDFSFPKE